MFEGKRSNAISYSKREPLYNMNTLHLRILLLHVFSYYCITSFRGIIDAESSNLLDWRQTPLLRLPTSLPPGDCMAKSLEYLGRAKDIESFKCTSTRCLQIYDRYKRYQSAKFRALNLLFDDSPRGCKRYKSMDDLLDSVSCIPDVYLDVMNNPEILALGRCQYRLNEKIVRGLTNRQNQPFLSLSLCRHPMESVVLICVFGFDGLTKVIVIKSYHSHYQSTTLRQSNYTENFDVQNLKDVLDSKQLLYQGEMWYLGILKCLIMQFSYLNWRCEAFAVLFMWMICLGSCCAIWYILFMTVRLLGGVIM